MESMTSVTPATAPASRAESLYCSTVLSVEEEAGRVGGARLNTQQWILQRKKIGLSRRSVKTLQARIAQEQSKMSAITFIETHFNCVECCEFTADAGAAGGPTCHCGGPLQLHTSRPGPASPNTGTQLSPQYPNSSIPCS